MIAIDIEATCGDIPPSEMETIEIAAVRLPSMATFHRFVRPIIHPKLTQFCVDMTGIKQEDIDAAHDFGCVLSEFEEWVEWSPGDRRLCAWGSFDRRQLSQDARLFAVEFAFEVLDLSRIFKKQTGRVVGREKAMKFFGRQFQGARHSAKDDAISTALIAADMIERGWLPSAPSSA